MTDQERLLAWLRREEGYRRYPYRDTEGKLTIGIGYNLDAGMPEDEATALTKMRSDKIALSVDARWPWASKLSPPRYGALVAMAYQMGVEGLSKFKRLLAAMESGDYETAARAALDSLWAKQDPDRSHRTAEIIRTGQWPKA